ncbi:Sulfate adenylyltransferase subunit 2 [Madurella mycetomatis]|uniref:Sulfate adenylyltransferase subunit 2 n=1 Tax=Madurella mycetomatis TaxID=100816 RepID=A0A175WHF1_9PEZI|nr:Sulfate adenylyltransferase subunit 2 [Madurella mycetomatis]
MPEWENPSNILPITNLEIRLELIAKLERFWQNHFTELTDKPDSEWKPFNNLQIAALMVVDIKTLEAGIVFPRQMMEAVCNIPYLTKLFFAKLQSKGNFQSDEAKPDIEEIAVPNMKQAKKRLQFDEDRCIIFKTADPKVCHIVPFSANNTESNRKDFCGRLAATDCLLFNTDEGGQACKYFASTIGISDKKWNMISLHRQLSKWWGNFYFGLKHLGVTHAVGKPAEITTLKLQFHWMPTYLQHRNPLPRNPEDFIAAFTHTNGSHSTLGPMIAASMPASGRPLQTGDIFYVDIETRDADKMIMAFHIQWVLTQIAAMAGGVEALELLEDEPDYVVGGRLPGLVRPIDEGLAFKKWLDQDCETRSVSSAGKELLTEDVQDDGSKGRVVGTGGNRQDDDNQTDIRQEDDNQTDIRQDDDNQTDIRQDDSGGRMVDENDEGKPEPHPKKRLWQSLRSRVQRLLRKTGKTRQH